ncbi:MAG TPA: hypothetical protein VFW00_04495 [Rhodocyclaceae bacterium]|nr:hypothetical protein [Rhodocyclaceae bacterium]
MSTDKQDKTLTEAEAMIADAEMFLNEMSDEIGKESEAVLAQVKARLKVARRKLADLEKTAIEKTKVVAEATDEYVHDNPWASIGIAAAAGMVIGMLIARK